MRYSRGKRVHSAKGDRTTKRLDNIRTQAKTRKALQAKYYAKYLPAEEDTQISYTKGA